MAWLKASGNLYNLDNVASVSFPGTQYLHLVLVSGAGSPSVDCGTTAKAAAVYQQIMDAVGTLDVIDSGVQPS